MLCHAGRATARRERAELLDECSVRGPGEWDIIKPVWYTLLSASQAMADARRGNSLSQSNTRTGRGAQ